MNRQNSENKSISQVRVRYAETDQMGVVHHGNYAQFFEIGRLSWLEGYGISYKSMEEEGVQLPVYELKTRYKKPAYFDDVLTIETSLREKPTVKITFDYVIKNENKDVITTGETTLVFMNTKSNRPIRCPDYILSALGF